MNFLQTLSSGKTLLFDGAMGSLLTQKGVDTGANNNITAPEKVAEVHKEYIEAGSDCIITNTLTLNSIYAAKRGISASDCDEANRAAARIALTAAAGKAFVFGDLGSTGEMLKPFGTGDRGQFYNAYCRQAKVLAENKIDGFIIETVFDLEEAKIILQACQDTSDLPVILSMTFSTAAKGGRTIMGNSAVAIAQAAATGGAIAVGANCGDLAPEEFVPIIKEMLPAGLPIIIQPNAGKPRLQNGITYYDLAAAEFAEGLLECHKAGAQLLGGCCGTTPQHIAAIKQLLV